MNKSQLLKQVLDRIKESSEIEKTSKFPYLYENCRILLQKIADDIQNNESDAQFQQHIDSLGLFSVREVDNYDPDVAQKLCEVCTIGDKLSGCKS